MNSAAKNTSRRQTLSLAYRAKCSKKNAALHRSMHIMMERSYTPRTALTKRKGTKLQKEVIAIYITWSDGMVDISSEVLVEIWLAAARII